MATQETHAIEMEKKDAGGAEDDIEVVEEDTWGMKLFAKIILPWSYLFAFTGFGSILLFMLWGKNQMPHVQVILLMIADLPVVFGGILFAWGTFKFGVIMDQINRFKQENDKYQDQISDLEKTDRRLAGKVEGLSQRVTALKSDATELEGQMEQFEELHKQLTQGDNEQLHRMVNDTNQMLKDLRETVLEHERAYLKKAFHVFALHDGDGRMSKDEYTLFLGQLSGKQRVKFEEEGTFEELAGDDEQIDLNEFQGILEHVLADVDELLKAEFSQE